MNCKYWRKQISLSLDEPLDARHAAGLEQHLQSCAQCRQVMEEHREISSMLKKIPAEEVVRSFNQSVWQKIEAPDSSPVGIPSKRLVTLAAAAVAGIILAVTGSLFFGDKISYKKAHRPEAKVVVSKPKPEIKPVRIRAGEDELSSQQAISVIVLRDKVESTVSEEGPMPQVEPKVAVPAGDREMTTLKRRQRHVQSGRSFRIAGGPVVNKESNQEEHKVSVSSAAGDTGQADNNQVTTQADEPMEADIRIMNNKIRINRQERMGISVQLEEPAQVIIKIYSRTGKQVKIINNGFLSAGLHQYEWDGTTETGETVASGIYVMMVGGDIKEEKFKIAVIK